jgi:AAA domain
MQTVAFLNKKGGVGKTSGCHHLSGALARKGLRVLLVDAGPQTSLSQGLLEPAVGPAGRGSDLIFIFFAQPWTERSLSVRCPAASFGIEKRGHNQYWRCLRFHPDNVLGPPEPNRRHFPPRPIR